MKKIWIPSIMFVSVVIVVSSFIFWPRLATKYAPKFSSLGLASLKQGDSLSAITNAIGLPLSFTVIAQPDPAGRYAPLYMRQVDRINEYTNKQDALLLLRYSEPRYGEDYFAVEIILKEGNLLQVREFTADD